MADDQIYRGGSPAEFGLWRRRARDGVMLFSVPVEGETWRVSTQQDLNGLVPLAARPEVQAPTREALVELVAIAIRQAYADSTANGDAELCGESIEDWYGEARAAIGALLASGVFDGSSGTAVTLHAYTDKQLDLIRAETLEALVASGIPDLEADSWILARAAEYREGHLTVNQTGSVTPGPR